MGVDRAFMVTPALNILGVPMGYAIGTGLADMLGKATIATYKYTALGYVDFRLGLLTGVRGLTGGGAW